MDRRARERGMAAVRTLFLATFLAACGSTATPAPSGDAGPTNALPSSGSAAAPSPTVTPSATASSAASSSASAPAPSSQPASLAPASPPASGSVPPLPPAGAAHRFGCASLIAAKQVSSITHIPSVLFIPPGAAAKVPKGETLCKYVGSKPGPGKTFLILTTDVYVLTGGARASFDATWAQLRGSALVSTVDGVGDDAAWEAAQDTLVGIAGKTAFIVTLEPSPLSIFTSASGRAAAAALARILVSHL